VLRRTEHSQRKAVQGQRNSATAITLALVSTPKVGVSIESVIRLSISEWERQVICLPHSGASESGALSPSTLI
jgi:hypothetical protein